MWWKSKHELYLEAELARARDENRILLAALLERTVSREASLMLRKPEELELSVKNLKDRAAAAYEARRQAVKDQPAQTESAPIRAFRGLRQDLENASLAEAKAQAVPGNDSLARLEAIEKGGKNGREVHESAPQTA